MRIGYIWRTCATMFARRVKYRRARTAPTWMRIKIYRYALLHIVTILGEAASKLSQEFRTAHGDVPWGDIIGTRNRLIHGYDIVNLDFLWETVEADLPELLQKLNALLEQ